MVFENTAEARARFAPLVADMGTPLALWPVSTTAVAIWQRTDWPMTEVHHPLTIIEQMHGPFIDPRQLPGEDADNHRRPNLPWAKWYEAAVFLNADGSTTSDFCRQCPARVKCTITGGPQGLAEAACNQDAVKGDTERIERRCAFFRSAAAGLDLNQLVDRIAKKTVRNRDEMLDLFWAPMMKNAVFDAARLQALGFWVTNRWTVFDPGLGLTEGRWTARRRQPEMSMAMAILLSQGSLTENRRIVASRIRALGAEELVHGLQWREAPGVNELCFSRDQVRLAQMAMKSAAALRSEPAEKKREFKKTNCTKCVYACKSAPYDLQPCTVTPKDVSTPFKGVSVDALCAWIAAFSVTDVKFQVPINKSQYRLLIGWGPDAPAADKRPIAMVMRSLNVPFIDRGHWPLAEYLDKAPGLVDRYGMALHHAQQLDDGARNCVAWALLNLADYGHWRHDRARFYSGTRFDRKGKERDKRCRNDVLAIWVDTTLQFIHVKSDTKASDNGGGGITGPRGRSIRRDERPRYSTEYGAPFFTDILQITGRPLGSRRSYSNGYVGV